MRRTSNSRRTANRRILIADDHALVRARIRKVLAMDDRLDVVGEAATAGELLAWLAAGEVDLVLLDLAMPGCTGFDLLARVIATHPGVAVLVLAVHADGPLVCAALDAGVLGLVSKNSEPRQLIAAVHRVARGGVYVGPSLEERPGQASLSERVRLAIRHGLAI